MSEWPSQVPCVIAYSSKTSAGLTAAQAKAAIN